MKFPLCAWLALGLAALSPDAASQCGPELTILASDGSNGDQFGAAVDVLGQDLFVGARSYDGSALNQGAVYLFERQAGVWNEVGKLLASDASADADFGFDVAVDGDVLVVGARRDGASAYRAGAVYVFERGVGGWSEVAKLTAPVPVAEQEFGVSVDVSGSTIAVGAWGDTLGGPLEGAVYTYEKVGPAWNLSQTLTASDGYAPNRFGQAVSLEGDRLLASAPVDLGVGAVYVFERAGGAWSEQAKLVPADGASGGHFGNDLELEGDRFVVGRLQDPAAGLEAGSAYVFERDPVLGTWQEMAKLLPSDGATLERFGNAVSMSGDDVVVGAFRHGAAGVGAGAAYTFVHAGGAWLQVAKLLPAGATAFQEHGYEVRVEGGEVFVGAREGAGASSTSGVLTVFPGAGTGGASLVGCPSSISVSTGGAQTLTLAAGPAHGGQLYLVLGSSTGTSPAYPVDGVLLPLNLLFDPYAGFTLSNPNSALLQGTFGVLSPAGNATAVLVVPATAGLPVPLTLHHAYLVIDPLLGKAVFASNAVPLTLTP